MKKKRQTRVIAQARVGPDHAVTTIVSKGADKACYRLRPCDECPWRKDRPTGVFPAEAYRHSARTDYDMAESTFACHMAGKDEPLICAGFLIRGAVHNLAVRLALATHRLDLDEVKSDVPLYASYREMSEANGVDPEDPVLTPCRGKK